MSVPTLGELHREPYWLWCYCDACGHGAALPLAPFVIRWGPRASSDRLRRSARCKLCGARGGSLRLPGYNDPDLKYRALPPPA